MKLNTQAPRHSAFFRLAVGLFASYTVIVLWGVLFKCNRNGGLIEGYEAMRGQSVFERLFLQDDLVEWIKLALDDRKF